MFIHDKKIEEFVISIFHENNIIASPSCLQILGQALAYGDDQVQLRFMQENQILKPLKWVLQTCNIAVRKDSLWVLTNLTSTSEAITAFMSSETKIVLNVIDEFKKMTKNKMGSSKNK
jgi:hypothetical protein